MADEVRVGALRGIMMRGPGITETLPFYEDMWGLSLAHREDGLALLRGTGPEAYLYGLKDGPVYGIDHVHFAMPDRAAMEALHAQVTGKGHMTLGAPAPFDDWVGGFGFEMLDPDNRRLRFRCEARENADTGDWAKPRKVSHVVLNTPRHGRAAGLLYRGPGLPGLGLFGRSDGVFALQHRPSRHRPGARAICQRQPCRLRDADAGRVHARHRADEAEGPCAELGAGAARAGQQPLRLFRLALGLRDRVHHRAAGDRRGHATRRRSGRAPIPRRWTAG